MHRFFDFLYDVIRTLLSSGRHFFDVITLTTVNLFDNEYTFVDILTLQPVVDMIDELAKFWGFD